MVNGKELIGATEYVTLQTRCRINRCRYNRGSTEYMLRGLYKPQNSSLCNIRNIPLIPSLFTHYYTQHCVP
jgi:hypothetical protein